MFRFSRRSLVLAGCVLLTGMSLDQPTLAEGLPAADRFGHPDQRLAREPGKEDRAGERIREGAEFQALGYFRITGDRVTFYSLDGATQLRGLENLLLERIARKLEENPSQTSWRVTGKITEFRGLNYLLVTHAVMQAEATGRETAATRSGR